ncbi:MAG: hypothetical protein WD294_15320 [Phycisphaeraceae bacterium]
MDAILKYWKAALVVAAMAITGVTFAGCNTTEGMGRDLQGIGGAVENTAEQTRWEDDDAMFD